MKANELRIGNLVNSTLLNECRKIDAWALSVIEQGNYQNSHNTTITVFEPIPLTEEWLLKFGFERIINNWKVLDLVCFKLSWERLAGLALSLENESIYLPHIKYLHQLQNLFFALMGEELTIKGSEQ